MQDSCAYIVNWDKVVTLLRWSWIGPESDAVVHESIEQVFGLVNSCAAVAHYDSQAIDGYGESVGNGVPSNAFRSKLASCISNVLLKVLGIQRGPLVLGDSCTSEMSRGAARPDTGEVIQGLKTPSIDKL